MNKPVAQALADILGLPTDRRQVGLAFGCLGTAALGLVVLLGGDLVGIAYIAAAIVAYVSLHTRALPTLIFCGVAVVGLLGALSGNPSDWIQVGLAAGLAVLAAWPPAAATATQASSDFAIATRPGSSISEVSLPAGIDQVPATAIAGEKTPPVLSIKTVGRFALLADGGDLASALRKTPTSAFLWIHLLNHALSSSNGGVKRDPLADELSPGVSPTKQAERLRKLLWDIQHRIDPALAARVKADRGEARLALDDAELDVLQLRRLAAVIGSSGSLLDPDNEAAVAAALAESPSGEYLPDFEELERVVTGGRGVAINLVRQLRLEVLRMRGDLALALADTHLAAGHVDRALPVLERAHEESADRQDVFDRLVAACLRSGQTKRAIELRREFGIDAELKP
jgi:hypothetical protein